MSDAAKDSAYSIATSVGRLMEARVHRLKTRADADAYAEAFSTHIRSLPPGAAPVLLADHRPVVVYPQAAADRLVELFVQMNTLLERVAIVVARSNATLVLQLERLVREAKYANRKVFYAPAEAERHLAASLGAAELQRARAFLGEWPGASPPNR